MFTLFNFNLKIRKPDNISFAQFDSFCLGCVSQYKRLLRRKLSISKCDYIDSVIKSNNLISLSRYGESRKHLTYDLLLYVIKNVIYIKDKYNNGKFAIEVNQNNPFTNNAEDLSLFIRLIEYGNSEIKPLNIFNATFADYSKNIVEDFCKIFGLNVGEI